MCPTQTRYSKETSARTIRSESKPGGFRHTDTSLGLKTSHSLRVRLPANSKSDLARPRPDHRVSKQAQRPPGHLGSIAGPPRPKHLSLTIQAGTKAHRHYLLVPLPGAVAHLERPSGGWGMVGKYRRCVRRT